MSEAYRPREKKTRKQVPFWLLALGVLAAGLGIMMLDTVLTFQKELAPAQPVSYPQLSPVPQNGFDGVGS